MTDITAAKTTAIYCGTFNPIHTAHLVMAQAVLNRHDIGRVLFIPSGLPPHRPQDSDMASSEHRLQMVQLATQDNPGFVVSDMELRRSGPSYTVDTLELLIKQGFVEAQQPIPFIIGSDALAGLASWHRWQDMIGLCRFLQIQRPGQVMVTDIQGQPLLTDIVDCPEMAISATQIRQWLQQGRDTRYVLPDAVRDYIAWNGLYR